MKGYHVCSRKWNLKYQQGESGTTASDMLLLGYRTTNFRVKIGDDKFCLQEDKSKSVS